MTCAILERTSGFEPRYETTAPRYLKFVPASTTPLPDLSLEAKGAEQDTMVYKIMLNRQFCSQVNLKPAFVVSDQISLFC